MPPPASPDPRPVILVADDDQDILDFIEVNLGSAGLRVVTASDGETALARAREHRPALVLLGLGMPGPDGFEVCRRLRGDWRYGDPAVILLAARSLSGDRARSLASGADDFILKPFDPIELVTRVQVTLRRLEEMRAASPLTGLPGNVQIHRELKRRVECRTPVSLLYLDLDNFKAFNDRYGFLRGDDAIRAVADVLRQAVEGRPGAFLGHVGGDDFIVLSDPAGAEEIAREVVDGFAARVGSLYDPEDSARGFIELEDRRGRRARFPLLTLSVGVASNLGQGIEDFRVLVDKASEMKRYAKSQEGSSVVADRRDSGADLFGGMMQSREHAERFGERRRFEPVEARALAPRAWPTRPRRPLRQLVARPAVLLLVALVGLLAPATGVLAQTAHPGELLYPVKLMVESTRLMLETDPQGDLALHLEFAERRLDELALVVASGDARLVRKVADNLRHHLGASVADLRRAAGRSPDEVPSLRDEAGAALTRHVQELEVLAGAACAGRAPAQVCLALGTALNESAGALEAVRSAGPGGDEGADETPGRPGKGKGKGSGERGGGGKGQGGGRGGGQGGGQGGGGRGPGGGSPTGSGGGRGTG